MSIFKKNRAWSRIYQIIEKNERYGSLSPYMYHANPFAGPVLMFAVWIVQLLIAFLICRDAKEHKNACTSRAIHAILPMFGYFGDVPYVVIWEF
jgi:hypothetical protein